ncbi:response regulator transcription factor [Lentzea sp. PSKA42]|uniref:Response regulator transcription factor n=1 Tax=Lentzea indica TaxID=2604800 RepID=A0ABX1FXP9_9PSEU|nr:response regulator transcription factor [Lentzea indica]NKE63809.1 response regulator transcription factor [Lentzea indica]
MRVLVTEDDEDIRFAVETSLRAAGFAVDIATDLPEADEALFVNTYDCVIFDRVLPSGDALHYVKHRRLDGWGAAVLFLTGINNPVEGLPYGDDYLVKPFAMPELIARVRSLCRLTAVAPRPVLRHGDVELDLARRTATRGGRALNLTVKEFTVLERLVAAAGQPVRRDDLIAAAWDAEVRPSSNVLDVVITVLRQKIGPPPLVQTVRGVGYRCA